MFVYDKEHQAAQKKLPQKNGTDKMVEELVFVIDGKVTTKEPDLGTQVQQACFYRLYTNPACSERITANCAMTSFTGGNTGRFSYPYNPAIYGWGYSGGSRGGVYLEFEKTLVLKQLEMIRDAVIAHCAVNDYAAVYFSDKVGKGWSTKEGPSFSYTTSPLELLFLDLPGRVHVMPAFINGRRYSDGHFVQMVQWVMEDHFVPEDTEYLIIASCERKKKYRQKNGYGDALKEWLQRVLTRA